MKMATYFSQLSQKSREKHLFFIFVMFLNKFLITERSLIINNSCIAHLNIEAKTNIDRTFNQPTAPSPCKQASDQLSFILDLSTTLSQVSVKIHRFWQGFLYNWYEIFLVWLGQTVLKIFSDIWNYLWFVEIVLHYVQITLSA